MVDIVFHEGASTDSTNLQALISRKSHLTARHIEFFLHKARLTIQGHDLNDVTSLDEVRNIEKVGKVVSRNNQARLTVEADVQPRQGQAYGGNGSDRHRRHGV
jgi:hypothetical protein